MEKLLGRRNLISHKIRGLGEHHPMDEMWNKIKEVGPPLYNGRYLVALPQTIQAYFKQGEWYTLLHSHQGTGWYDENITRKVIAWMQQPYFNG